MIIITLFFSCLLIIGAYWNSYSNLLKQLKGPNSQPPQYNVIILAGDSDRSSQDLLVRLKEELLNNSIDLSMIYDEVKKRHGKDVLKYTNTISNGSVPPSVQDQPGSEPDKNGRVSGTYQGKRVYAVIQKCTGNECQFVNLTFASDEPAPTVPKITINPIVATQMKLTKIKSSQVVVGLPVKKEATRFKTNVPKIETTTILRYTESVGLHAALYRFVRVVLSYLNASYTLPVFVIAMQVFSRALYCYRWGKVKGPYEDVRRERNVPGIRKILKRIVRNLRKISDEQEGMFRSKALSEYAATVTDMSRRVENLENELSSSERRHGEEAMTLVMDKSNEIVQALNRANSLEVRQRNVMKEEKQHLLLLYEMGNLLLTEGASKLTSAETQFDQVIGELEAILSTLGLHEKLRDKMRSEIDALRSDRNDLLRFYDHPSLVKLMTGNKELTDQVPYRFLISTNQGKEVG